MTGFKCRLVAFLVIILLISCLKTDKAVSNGFSNIEICDINKDKKNELLAIQGSDILVYKYINQKMIEIYRNSTNDSIKYLYCNAEVFLISNNYLYRYLYQTKSKLVKLYDLRQLDYNYYINVKLNRDNSLELIGIKYLTKDFETTIKRAKIDLISLRSNNVTTTTLLPSIEPVHSIIYYHNEKESIAVIHGAAELVERITLFEVVNKKLEKRGSYKISQFGIFGPMFFYINNCIYFSSLIEDDVDNQGIFKFSQDYKNFIIVKKDTPQAYYMDVGDLDLDKKTDIVWVDIKGQLHYSLSTESKK